MTKLSIINREKKRFYLFKKFLYKRIKLKKIINNFYKSDKERYIARLKLQCLPRNSALNRRRNRCFITGRPRGNLKIFGINRIKLRKMIMNGEIPGVIKSSW